MKKIFLENLTVFPLSEKFHAFFMKMGISSPATGHSSVAQKVFNCLFRTTPCLLVTAVSKKSKSLLYRVSSPRHLSRYSDAALTPPTLKINVTYGLTFACSFLEDSLPSRQSKHKPSDIQVLA